MKKTLGQIGIGTLIGGGVSILIALASSFLAQTNITQNKIDSVKAENTAALQRVATLEEAVITLKKDNDEIKKDLKEILKILR